MKNRNYVEVMRDEVKAQKALLAAKSSKVAQKLAGVQKNVSTIRESLPEHRYRLSFYIIIGFQELWRRLLNSARYSVQIRQ